MSATAKPTPAETTPRILRPDLSLPIFRAEGRDRLFIRDGTTIDGGIFDGDTEVFFRTEDLKPGRDFFVYLDGDAPVAWPAGDAPSDLPRIGGFHFAPGGNAQARSGGDDVPAINPFSLWDAGFRPACPDPRGMALVEGEGLRFWCDIYLLGTGQSTEGTSRFGAEIADGLSMPRGLNFAAAEAVYTRHGKRLPTYDEFRVAAFGVTEKSSAKSDPKKTGLDAARTSRFGIMQATGNLWIWGTDGDPDDARPSIFGGSWISGGDAGSRCASLDYWPEGSYGDLSARGLSDHLQPE